jgi:hypothetical protein
MESIVNKIRFRMKFAKKPCQLVWWEPEYALRTSHTGEAKANRRLLSFPKN